MTRVEEIVHNARNKENNLRYIRSKIIHANAEDMALIKEFVCCLGIIGWDDTEYHRPIPEEKEVSA